MTESARARLSVCCPRQPIRVILARLSEKINALYILWPGTKRRFICNGMELNGERTFASYGIRTGDAIVAIPDENKAKSLTIAQWLSVTSDSERFNEHVSLLLNPNTYAEVVRLRDLRATRMESRMRSFRSTCVPPPPTDQCEVLKDVLVDYTPSLAPQISPMPVCWSE